MAATHAATGQELITLVIRESDARAAAACGLAACGQASEYYSPACSGNKHRFALPPSRKLNSNTNTIETRMQIQRQMFLDSYCINCL